MFFLNNFLKNKLKPKARGMYGVLHGYYIGEILIFINKENDDTYNFLATPSFKNISMSFEDFKNGIEKYIIEYIKIMPKKHWVVFKEKFEQNKEKFIENNNN